MTAERSEQLTTEELASVAEGLEGWQAEAGHLRREVMVAPLDAQALGAGLRAVAAEYGRELDLQPKADGITVVFGADQALTRLDVEVIAHMDRVINGDANPPGGQDAG